MVKVLQHLTASEWLIASAVLVLTIFVLGAVSNAVLRDFGFGTIPNGLLVVLGLLGGVFLRSITLGFQ